MSWLKSVLLATDLSACSWAALDYAAFLATTYGARLEVLRVVPTATVDVEGPTRALRRTLRSHSRPAARGARVLIARSDHPADAIIAHAPRHDLVVLGQYGRGERRPIGLVAAQVHLRLGGRAMLVPQSVRTPRWSHRLHASSLPPIERSG